MQRPAFAAPGTTSTRQTEFATNSIHTGFMQSTPWLCGSECLHSGDFSIWQLPQEISPSIGATWYGVLCNAAGGMACGGGAGSAPPVGVEFG